MSNISKPEFLVLFQLFLVSLSAINAMENEPSAKGIVVLDSLTFNKTVSSFPYSFVSFTLSSFTQSLHHLSDEQNQKVFNQ